MIFWNFPMTIQLFVDVTNLCLRAHTVKEEKVYNIPIYYSVKIQISTEIRNNIMIKKEYKIHVVIAPTIQEREQLIARLAVRLGFAMTASDAMKIIKKDIYSIDIPTTYFVLCSSYNFRGAVLTTQRLYELAARGICVILGAKSLPREYEFIAQTFYPGDLR